MALSTRSYTCIRCLLASTSSSPRFIASSTRSRSYATAVGESSSASEQTRRPSTKFSDQLNAGPAFSDFVGAPEKPLSREDALELRTVVVGPPGKQKKITRLPEWLKTPIPEGGNFKRLRNDLRGLNLHTGGAILLLLCGSVQWLTRTIGSVRGGEMSEHFRLLGGLIQVGSDGNNHAHGRHMHAGMQILFRQDV